MKVEKLDLTVRDLVAGYRDDGEGGVVGYGGKLDIRPPYQREFIYKGQQRAAVITSIIGGFPLNVMYWAARDDGSFEIVDGQQRTISIGQYVNSEFSVNGQYFHNLRLEEQDKILGYQLMVYICSGTHRDKLDWFRTVNIAGEKLTDQELRNAVYSGTWTADAKGWFSRTGCPAAGVGGDYMTGSPLRQDYLETVIKWISEAEGAKDIDDYMAIHQHDENAKPLWEYFEAVIEWAEYLFPTYRKQMKGVDWGTLYNSYKDKVFYSDSYEAEIEELLDDDDVIESGIYPYIITRDRRHIISRRFTDRIKRRVYKKQHGICKHCDRKFKISEMEPDHITPWSEGGKSNEENCQVLCIGCNRIKGKK